MINIESSIMSATKEMDYLNTLGGNPHVANYSKYLILQAIPINLLLWGFSLWPLCTILNNNVEVFLQCQSRQLLIMYMFQVKDDHIRRADIQGRFYNIPSVENMIAARQILLLGKFFDVHYLIVLKTLC